MLTDQLAVAEAIAVQEIALWGCYRTLPRRMSFGANATPRGQVLLTPTGYALAPSISPLDVAVPVTVNLVPIGGAPISAVACTASTVQDPGGTALQTDITRPG
jgi:hypothetical protein